MPFKLPDDYKRKRSGDRRRATGGEEIQNYSFADIDVRQEKQNEEYLRIYESIIREIVKAQEEKRKQEESISWFYEMQFKLALLSDRILSRLEQIRDENRPKFYNEGWSDAFCMAVRTIPEVRVFVEECEIECIKEKKS